MSVKCILRLRVFVWVSCPDRQNMVRLIMHTGTVSTVDGNSLTCFKLRASVA